MKQTGGGASQSALVRFLAFCGRPDSLKQRLLSLVPSVDRPERLNRILSCVDLVVYASPETPFILLEPEQGVVLGSLVGPRYLRNAVDGRATAEALCQAIRDDLAGVGPRRSGYVAFLRTRSKIGIFRGRTGAVAAHFQKVRDVTAFFSHTELCCQLNQADSDIHQLEPGMLHWFSAGRPQDSRG